MKNILFALALLISFISFGQSADEYFDSGYDKAEAKDYYGAIADYTKAIEINPNYAIAYTNRGLSKAEAKDYNASIADFTKAIELDPNDAEAYYNRGLSKAKLKDYYGAIGERIFNLNSDTKSTAVEKYLNEFCDEDWVIVENRNGRKNKVAFGEQEKNETIIGFYLYVSK